MMKTRCGVKQGLWKCWFRLQNEIQTRWGDSKNEVGLKHFKTILKWGHSWWKRDHSWWKKCRNQKNEIKTRWGDSMNLLYCSHIINKSRRSYGFNWFYIWTYSAVVLSIWIIVIWFSWYRSYAKSCVPCTHVLGAVIMLLDIPMNGQSLTHAIHIW